MLKVVVGSKNPVKIGAVRTGFEAMLPGIDLEVISMDVASGVAEQPMSDEESIKGATNRAKAVLAADLHAVYGVGVEGGMQMMGDEWTDTQWVVVINKAGQIGHGQSVRIPVPDSIMKIIHEGKELGEVIDQMFQQTNMKQAGGYIGEVTHGVINREQMIFGAVVSALIPFANPDLFQN